jgi:hypothetical protein
VQATCALAIIQAAIALGGRLRTYLRMFVTDIAC